jgi:hypothetical protein
MMKNQQLVRLGLSLVPCPPFPLPRQGERGEEMIVVDLDLGLEHGRE